MDQDTGAARLMRDGGIACGACHGTGKGVPAPADDAGRLDKAFGPTVDVCDCCHGSGMAGAEVSAHV